MHVVLIAKPGHTDTGVARYVRALSRALQAQGITITIVAPHVPLPRIVVRWVHRWMRWDLDAFFRNYPVWAQYPPADLYHLTSQNLASLLVICPPRGKTVVTVHDLIPWLTRNDAELRSYRHAWEEWFDRLALWGVMKADAILTDSEHTRRTVERELRINPAVPVQTVLLGLD
jgi:glycosyltransferase involved in cell wall biosynthesis